LICKQWFGITWDECFVEIPLVKSIAKQARLKTRPFEHINLCVREADDSWSLNHVLQGMELWCNNMNKEIFCESAVVEQFVWVYSLYMVHGFGGLDRAEWCESAMADTVQWLRNLRYDTL